MGCPVVHTSEKSEPISLDSEIVDIIEGYRTKIATNCYGPLRLLERCRERVIAGGASDCVEEASCFIACEKVQRAEKRRIKDGCGKILDIYHPTLRENYILCLENHKDNTDVCQDKLQRFITCAAKILQ